ncbi:hypothetical protein J4E85_010479 [Alternaria conjuncta]|uniref:uncharacterized protein n=1 Tax=Alternaria conjuncta TaxID=181017 RepID=UPI00221F2439|nr:uncharacterized protein J4E85_010479 [Alternaria conjuncta]KAI4915354.1 hypothetical protein J4E85_010479 [Alternaria conjuncta]
MTAPSKPKQALDFDGALLQELQGDRDEEMWDEALDFIVEKLPRNEWSKGEGGVKKIRMVADVAIVKKGGL